ncbi:SDR family NAD(P)-dependent oxidoreductase [Mycobacterium sp. ITM-2016-00317]|uniref:SDR family NAD(P)-dependent oxidoreductase n=1 Tax=Mycobacterium sp. ITM-2016-00317 TaxID=2099694 RepID=UPI00287F58B2|nr:SDR family NAD(P)-dependent oxidoreductase [Mycobacterium sp. ITM-2016-00317]WNG88101.1 SDR family NAD(P)-dependent oxidoreductase [Mycobacterium sp. ITM-2016-00317]
MNIDLTGKTALVTGSTQGIGLAIARSLADADGAQTLVEALPQVDILVNNLGIFGAVPAGEITDELWRNFFEVNVLAAARLIRLYLPGTGVTVNSVIAGPTHAAGVEDFVYQLVDSPLASATTGGALRVDGGYVDAILS